MYCRYCGTELNRKDNVCLACGKDNSPKKVAAAEKKKASKKMIKTIIICVLVVALLVPTVYFGVKGIIYATKPNDVMFKDNYAMDVADAAKHRDVVIASIGQYKLTNAQLQVFYWTRVYDFLSQVGSYVSMYGLDLSKPLGDQVRDKETGTTWEQAFLEQALTDWENYVLMSEEAKKEGYKMDEETQKQVDNLYEELEKAALKNNIYSVEGYLEISVCKGCTFEDYKYYAELFGYAQSYYNHKLEQTEVTDSELETYFSENSATLKSNYGVTKDSGKLVDVRHILIMPKGATEDTIRTEKFDEEAWAYAETTANDILAQWKAGEQTEEAFAALATEKTQDSGSKENGGLYGSISSSSSLVKPFLDWCMDASRAVGDTAVVKTEYGYHVMYYSFGEEGWIVCCRNGVRSEKMDKMMTDLNEACEAEINYKKLELVTMDLISSK